MCPGCVTLRAPPRRNAPSHSAAQVAPGHQPDHQYLRTHVTSDGRRAQCCVLKAYLHPWVLCDFVPTPATRRGGALFLCNAVAAEHVTYSNRYLVPI